MAGFANLGSNFWNFILSPQVLSNIALEGIMTPESGAAWLQEQVEALLAERSK